MMQGKDILAIEDWDAYRLTRCCGQCMYASAKKVRLTAYNEAGKKQRVWFCAAHGMEQVAYRQPACEDYDEEYINTIASI